MAPSITPWLEKIKAEAVARSVFCVSNEDSLCSNVYVLLGDSGEFMLVDSGDGSVSFPDSPALVVLTHHHFDHTKGISPKWSNVLMHPLDLAPACRAYKYAFLPANCKPLHTGSFRFSQFEFEVFHTPGHTQGCVCLLEKRTRILFSGDTLFAGGITGRTDLEGGDENQLLASLDLISSIDYSYLCPGHGAVSARKGDN